MHKRVRRVLLIVVATPAISGGWVVYRVVYTLRGIPDAYAMWDTGLLLIDYMQMHEKRWPGGWDDLNESWKRRQPGNSGVGEHLRGGMTLEQMRMRVVVDWNVDVAKIARTSEHDSHFHAVWTVDGNTTLWSGGDPNEMVWDYLHGDYDVPSTTTRTSNRK